MLKKIAKLEEKLNSLVLKLMELLTKIFLMIIPQKFINWVKETNRAIKEWIYTIFINLRNWTYEFILSLKNFKGWFVGREEDLQKLGQAFKGKLLSIKAFLLKTPLKSTVEFTSKKVDQAKQKVHKKLNSGITSQLVMAGLAFLMIGGGLYGVYLSSTKIIEQEFPYREPASVQEYDEKPEYYYYKDQTLRVQNIKVPLNVMKVGKMTSLTIDFSVRTSTRFARYYLSENEHKLKDYFFTSVQPIVSDFAIEEEGKEVLKEKIQKEVQRFLDKEKVEGQILEVNILFIVGT